MSTQRLGRPHSCQRIAGRRSTHRAAALRRLVAQAMAPDRRNRDAEPGLPIRRQTKLGLIRETMGLAGSQILPGVAKWA